MDAPTAAAVLGVAPGVSKDDLVRAFRARAKRVHPDVAGSNEAFVRLRAAYDRLLPSAPAASDQPARSASSWFDRAGRRPIERPTIDLSDRPRRRPAPGSSAVTVDRPAARSERGLAFAAHLDRALDRQRSSS